MSKLKPCPFCGGKDIVRTNKSTTCADHCLYVNEMSLEDWNNRPIEDELRAEKEKFRRMWIDDTVTLQDKLEKTKEATKQFIKNAREGQYESMINSYSMPANDLVDFERALKDIEETTNV